MKGRVCLFLWLPAAVILAGCGGVAGDPPPAKKAAIIFAALSTARLDSPISGIDLSFVLPGGMEVATAGGVSGAIESGAVSSGKALAGTSIAYGTYSASTRRVRLSMGTVSDAYRSGEFLRLTCLVADDAIVAADALQVLETSLSVLKVAGYDSGTRSTTVLTGKVKVTMALGWQDAP